MTDYTCRKYSWKHSNGNHSKWNREKWLKNIGQSISQLWNNFKLPDMSIRRKGERSSDTKSIWRINGQFFFNLMKIRNLQIKEAEQTSSTKKGRKLLQKKLQSNHLKQQQRENYTRNQRQKGTKKYKGTKIANFLSYTMQVQIVE